MNISFADFWDGFIPENNFFLDLFQSIQPDCRAVPFSNTSTDLLVYSCFGKTHSLADRKKVKKIFYTGENLRPNFQDCDFSLTFDFPDYGGRNIRLPLWMLQIDWFNKKNYTNPEFVIPLNELNVSRFSNKPKQKFCSIVFSSPRPNRTAILKKLSSYKQIDIFGTPFKNLPYGEEKKCNVISNYKFNICFENTIYPGYYTEKLIHAKVAGCVPLYCADENCKQDFNKESFINLNDFESIEDFVEKIIFLDQDDNAYSKMSNESLFKDRDPNIFSIINSITNILSSF